MADWSNSICITLWSCFCSLLTSNWEVSTGRLPYSLTDFIQTTQKFVISSYIGHIKTNLPIGKHTLRVFARNFEEIVGKCFFDASFMCLSRFVAFRFTFNDLCCWTQRCCLLSRIHLRVTKQSWQTSPNEAAVHFKVVFVVCWHPIGKLVQVVYNCSFISFIKLHKLWS